MLRHVLLPNRAQRRFGLLCLMILATSLSAVGQQPEPADADGDKAQREKRLAEMRRRADAFQVFRVEGEERVALERLESPLMRFDDDAREFHDGTLWAWGEPGRPLALLALEQYGTADKPAWWYELVSLSDGQVAAEGPDAFRWEPNTPGIEWQVPADAPDPAGRPAARLSQMKELARRLTVHEIGRTGQRFELRLLPQPIHRYEDPETGIDDGAIFVFAYGTNPELLLLIESHRAGGDLPAWRWGFARTGAAELHVQEGDSEIWGREYVYRPAAQHPYVFFSRE